MPHLNIKSLSMGEQRSEAMAAIDIAPNGRWAIVSAEDGSINVNNEFRVDTGLDFEDAAIRFIDDDTVIVGDLGSGLEVEPKAHIITLSTRTTKHIINLGLYPIDIVASKNYVAFYYTDQGVFSGDDYSSNGIFVFDTNGHEIGGYRDLFKEKAEDIVDCYTASFIDNDTVSFIPYGFDKNPAFNYIEWNIKKGTQKVSMKPKKTNGSNSHTTFGDYVYMFGSYDNRSSIIEWKKGQKEECKVVGSFFGSARCLAPGRVLFGGDGHYFLAEIIND